MASLRTDSAAGRAAIARRRQRARNNNNNNAEQQQQTPFSSETTTTPYSTFSMASSTATRSTTTTSVSQQQRQRIPLTTHHPSNAQQQQEEDGLLNRSMQVADEAASVLESVRKRQQSPRSLSSANNTVPAASSSMTRRPENTLHTNSSTTSMAEYSKTQQQNVTIRGQQPTTRTTLLSSGDSLYSDTHSVSRGASSSLPRSKDDETNLHDDSYRQQQEEPTVEELEPVDYEAPIDAACLYPDSIILVRAHVQPVTLQANNNDDSDAATMTGQGLGVLSSELFQLCLVNQKQPILRYGDQIALVVVASSNNKTTERALGVKAVTTTQNDDNDNSTTPRIVFEIGFFHRRSNHRPEQWTVLRANECLVRIGQAALEHAPVIKDGPTAPVRSGDAIVLRNCQTGGLLSFTGKEPRLLTDSYAQNSTSKVDRSLLNRLQRHDLVVPSDQEIFHLLLSTVPPTPLWISGCSLDKRMFLDGSYLLHSDRHQVNAKLVDDDATLFGDNKKNRTSLFIDHSGHMQTSRLEQQKTPRGQEMVLLDELLGAFVGLEGQFVKIKSSYKYMEDLCFELVDDADNNIKLDSSLRSMTQELLPLASSFARVSHFVSNHLPGYEYGSVMQGFCEGLDVLLHEYMVFITGLEQKYRSDPTQDFLIRRLQVQVRPSLHAMSVLDRATRTVRDKKGGALMNALRKLKSRTYEGDVVADNVLQILLDKASVPYMKMLSQWLERGILCDPYNEFMVESCDGGSWGEQYKLVEDHVLQNFFSTRVTVERALAAGKYWSAVRACDNADTYNARVDSHQSQPSTLTYSMNAGKISSYVQTMYHKASRALVRLLMDDYNLIGSLRLMKRYFLLDQGDFFVNFLDAAEDELLKELPNLSRGRIQHWLNVSVQLTENNGEDGLVASASPRKDGRHLTPSGLRCRFAPESLTEHLDKLHAASGGIDTNEPKTPLRHAYGGMANEGPTGLDSFVVDFSAIPFPISLVLSKHALTSYQLLFRHLFFAKHVERRLVGIWQDHQAMKELQSLRGSLGPTFLLRQRMLHLLQNLIYYIMFEVIEPNWLEMEAAIASAEGANTEQTIDDILQVHTQFLKRTLEACLLTNRDLVRALTKLMTTCLLFSDQMKRFLKATKIEDDRQTVANEKQKVVQRSLNDRGGSRASLSQKRLRETMQNAWKERQQRVQLQTVRVQREVSSESYQKMIARFDEVFSDNLREFMVHLTQSDDLYHTHKVNLCIRLDYNGYVTSSMGLA